MPEIQLDVTDVVGVNAYGDANELAWRDFTTRPIAEDPGVIGPTLQIGESDPLPKNNIVLGVLLKYDLSSIPASAEMTPCGFSMWWESQQVYDDGGVNPTGSISVGHLERDGVWDDPAREAWRPSIGGYQETEDYPWPKNGRVDTILPGLMVGDAYLGSTLYARDPSPLWSWKVGERTRLGEFDDFAAGGTSMRGADINLWGLYPPNRVEKIADAIEDERTNNPGNPVIGFVMVAVDMPAFPENEFITFYSKDYDDGTFGIRLIVQFDVRMTDPIEMGMEVCSPMRFVAPGCVSSSANVSEAVESSVKSAEAITSEGAQSEAVESSAETSVSVSVSVKVDVSVSTSGEVC